MSIDVRHIECLQSKIQEVLENEIPNIEKAAQLMAENCLKGGRIYVFGSGHSHLIAEEMFIRAGGLALVHAMLHPVFCGSNVDGGDEKNAALYEKYYGCRK